MVPNVHAVIRCALDLHDEPGPRAVAGVRAKADSCSKATSWPYRKNWCDTGI